MSAVMSDGMGAEKKHFLSCHRVNKAESAGVQSLTRAYFKTVGYKFLI